MTHIPRFQAQNLAQNGEGVKYISPFGNMEAFRTWPDEPIDVLVGGTPCQSFSVAGLRKGLADPRGNLALTYLAIADKYRPEWLVWENVPGVFSSESHAAPDPCPPSHDLDVGRAGEEMEIEDEYDSEELHAFNCFLAGLSELGYGFAYRVLDAQYFGVPQRRRRVFVVGHLGDWRRAAAVLFERESLSWDSAPSRETRKDVAPTISARPTGGGGLGTDFDCDGGLIARSPNAHPNRSDGESETFIPVGVFQNTGQGWWNDGPVAQSVRADGGDCGGGTENLVAHSLRADGFDASEDGTGRGTPLVAIDLRNGTEGDLAMSLQGGGMGTERGRCINAIPHVAFQQSQSGMRAGDVHATLDSNNGSRRHNGAIVGSMVRRLTPRECERLQGFPDGYTDVPYRGKSAADGPRYKALGNSMAVPVMRWIGTRISMVNAIASATHLQAAE